MKTMNLMKVLIWILVAAVSAILLLYIGFYVYLFFALRSARKVAKHLNISADWIELTPQPPLKAEKRSQYLQILVDGYKRDDKDRNWIRLPDGTIVTPEVEILDEYGKVYNLHPSSLVSSGVGFTGNFAPRSSFPQDRSYTKVRIRSDEPFEASKIIWECTKSLK
jgi:hypothetical protein